LAEEWLRIKTAAAYAQVSPRTFRPWLKDGLRHVKLPTGTILLRKEWIDQYFEKFIHPAPPAPDQADLIVAEIQRGLK